MMNKEKKPAVHGARYLVLMSLVAALVFTACHEKKDVALPSTETKSVNEIRVEEVLPDRVVEVEKIPDVSVESVKIPDVGVEVEEIPDVVVE